MLVDYIFCCLSMHVSAVLHIVTTHAYTDWHNWEISIIIVYITLYIYSISLNSWVNNNSKYRTLFKHWNFQVCNNGCLLPILIFL